MTTIKSKPCLLSIDMNSSRHLMRQRIEELKAQTRLNTELNAKARIQLASLKGNSENLSSSGHTRSKCIKKSHTNINRQALVDYVTRRECYMQHVNYWQQIWLFTDNPIYEYEKCEGFENPTYKRRATKRPRNRMISSVDSLTDIYESMLDLNTHSDLSKQAKEISSPESQDSGLHSDDRHSSSSISNCKTRTDDSLYSSSCSTAIEPKSIESLSQDTEALDDIVHPEQHELPLGWVKCCDEEGIYYWHKPTGTVTRKPPINITKQNEAKIDVVLSSSPLSSSISPKSLNPLTDDYSSTTAASTRTNTTPTSSSSSPSSSSSNLNKVHTRQHFVRFYVHSLGWVRIDESDLTPERSSRAVNKCINDLSRGVNDFNDAVARWGEGKELYLDLQDNELLLLDPIDEKLLNKQSVSSIRVWGVGRDSGRDFAYVAKDKQTKIYMCHVFRCDSAPAKDIANALRDTCKRILEEKRQTVNSTRDAGLGRRTIDINLKHKSISFCNRSDITQQNHQLPTSASSACFLTPMPEPKKTISCKYLGSDWVDKPSGMNVLNEAIERTYQKAFDEYKREKKERHMMRRRRILSERDGEMSTEAAAAIMLQIDDDDIDEYELNEDEEEDEAAVTFENCLTGLSKERPLGIDCDVIVSPSSVSVYRSKPSQKTLSSEDDDDDEEDRLLFESRIRFLSFMGISTDIRLCGFIIHQADNKFKCHAFLCDNSAGLLCKTIEAACKLRYQKCLDAHPEMINRGAQSNSNKQQTQAPNLTRALSTRLFGLFETIKTRATTSFVNGQ